MKLALAAIAAAIAAPIVAAPEASAQVDSIRLGVMNHNICVSDCKNANKESPINIDGELRFGPSSFLSLIGSPHPYVMASINTGGDTSFAATGIEYDWKFLQRWHFEPGFGLAIHDGALNNKFPNGTQASTDYDDDHVLLGSRVLFRTNIVFTRDFTDNLGLQGIYEHLSNGKILGHGHNQGLDELGLRLVWHLK